MKDNSPPDLEAAKDRLEQALSRLEEMVARVGQGPEAGAQATARELVALKADHQSLGETLKEVEADYAALRQVTDTVSSRLDATILELKSILEG